MPLNLAPHEPEVEAIATERLRELFAHPAQSAPLFGAEIDPRTATLAAPHHGYVLDLDRLRDGEILPAARPYAMRYLVLVDPDLVGSVDVVRVEDGAAVAVARIGSGPYDAALLAALGEARGRFSQAEAETRFLLIPALCVVALWMHGPDEEIVPLLPQQEELAAGKSYSEEEIAPILRRLAESNH